MKHSPLAAPLGAIALSLMASAAVAVPIQADFEEVLDSPTVPSYAGPRVLQSLDKAFAAGPELTAADEILNDSDFGGSIEVDFDADGLGFTLTQAGGFTDNELFTLTISDIVFSDPERLDAVYRDTADLIDESDSDPFTEMVSFTDNSIVLTIDVVKTIGDEYYNFILGGTAHYSLEVVDTPLPAAAPLFAAGLGAMGFIARRRRARA